MDRRKRFFYNGIMLSAVAICMRSVGVVWSSFITRSVGSEGMGLYTLIMSVYAFGVTFASSGLNLTVTRLVAADIGECGGTGVGRIMKNAFIYAMIFSVTATVALFFFAPYFGATVLGDERCTLPLRILALSLIPIAISSLFSGYFVGVRRVSRNAAVQIVGQGAKIVSSVFFVNFAAPYGISYAVIALCVSLTLTEILAALICLCQYLLDKKRQKSDTPPRIHRFSDVSRMALPLALSAYIRSALLTIEHILIPARLRHSGDTLTESLSAYGMLHGMALPLLIYPMSPLSSFAGLLVPEFAEGLAEGDVARLKRIADKALNTTLIYASVCAVFVYTFAEELGYVIYGSFGVGNYIAILAPVIPIMYLDHVTDSMLKGIGEQVYSMWVNIFDSVLSVILVWFLIPAMGISGYAVVIVAMELFNFTLSAIRLKRRVPYKIHIVSSLALPLFASGCAAWLCRALFTFHGKEATPLFLVMKLVFSLCVFTAMYTILTKTTKKRVA